MCVDLFSLRNKVDLVTGAGKRPGKSMTWRFLGRALT